MVRYLQVQISCSTDFRKKFKKIVANVDVSCHPRPGAESGKVEDELKLYCLYKRLKLFIYIL